MILNTDYKSIKLIALFLIFLNTSSIGQLRIDSPYSRFGLGDLDYGYNAYQLSMGGAGYAVKDPFRISTINPASYANIDSGNFVFNASFDALFMNTKTETQSGGSNYFNLNAINFALPVTNWWRTSVGLMPFSTVGYEVSIYENLDSIGEVKYSHLGDGGITEFYWGNAFKITKKLSLGINTSYLFGNINQRQETELTEIDNSFLHRNTSTVDVRSIYLDYGLQFNTQFGKKTVGTNERPYFLGLGLVYAHQQNLNADQSTYAITYTEGSEGYEYIKDTVVYAETGSGHIVIPQKIGGGFSVGKYNKWMFAGDITFEEWSEYEAFGNEDSLSNSIRYNFGGEYYIGRYRLNAGFMFNDSYLTVYDTKINNYGIAFGVGFPLRNNKTSVSFIDLGFEFGRKGTTENNLIQQDYFKIKLGISIQNAWFQRSRYL